MPAPRPRRGRDAARDDLSEASGRGQAERGRRHQHLRPQLRRPLRGQRPRRRRPHCQRISTDPRRWQPELPPLHACARGVGQIERVYHPDRLQHPLRRKGPRGSGQFERISWDEALDEVARQMLRVRASYGNAAILDASRSGSLSVLHGRAAAQRFLYMFGGCTVLWSNMSAEAEIFAVRMTYRRQGRLQERRARADRLRQFQADRHVGLEPRRRHLRHRHLPVPEAGEEAGRAHRLRRPAPDAVERGAGGRAHLHPALDGRRRADRHGLCDRQRRPAGPGLLRHPRAGLRRGSPAARRTCRAPPIARISSALRTASPRRRNGPPRSPAFPRRPFAGWPSSSPPPSRPRCSAAMRRAGPPTASSSTAPPMRSAP